MSKRKHLWWVAVLALLAVFVGGILYARSSRPRLLGLSGSYLGQTPPGAEATRFAPGVAPEDAHTAAVFSLDGSEVYWKAMEVPGDEIWYSRLRDGQWTAPRPVPFGTWFFDSDDPFFSSDGQRLYYTSWRPLLQTPFASKERIWVVERRGRGWSRPRPVAGAVNDLPLHWQFSVAQDGTLYLAAEGVLYRSALVDGAYAAADRVEPPVNSDAREGTPYISPDERYLLFSSNRGGGGEDLYASFRESGGSWSEPANLGPGVNSGGSEVCPVVSPDGRYLFYTSNRTGMASIYWVDASVIESLRP